MGDFGAQDIRELAAAAVPPCISVYLPAHGAGQELRQQHIRFKNSLGLAEEQLLEAGMRKADAEELLAPARLLLDQADFWRPGQAVALFLCPRTFRHYRAAVRAPELVVVGSRFHFKPLMPALTGDGRFHLLCLSQHHVRLFAGQRDGLQELTLHGVPTSLDETVGHDWRQRLAQRQKSLQTHTRAQRGGGGAIYHGHASAGDFEGEVDKFLHQVDGGVRELLHDPRVPMVLAGVSRMRATFQRLTKYPAVIRDGIDGNPEELADEELHRRAWGLVEPTFLADREQALATYREAAGTERASDDLRTVLRAAHDGRVDTLFADLEDAVWGSYDHASDGLVLEQKAGRGRVDLVDLAAIETLLRGGTVYALSRAQMPDRALVSAVFRY